MKQNKRYFIEKSKEPSIEGKFVLFVESTTEHGINYTKVFKGKKKDCERERKERVEIWKNQLKTN